MWIESHQTLARHPKVIRLAARLKINRAQALGHLHLLWWWTLDFSPEGDLSVFSAPEIALGAEWSGDGEEFLAALQQTGWIDEDLSLHDWEDYAGKLLQRRRRNTQRKQEARAKAAAEEEARAEGAAGETEEPEPGESAVETAEASVRDAEDVSAVPILSEATVPNRTVPDLLENPSPTHTPPPPGRPRPESLEEALKHARTRQGFEEAVVRTWYAERDGQGWVRVSGLPVRNWVSDLDAWMFREARLFGLPAPPRGRKEPSKSDGARDRERSGLATIHQLPRL